MNVWSIEFLAPLLIVAAVFFFLPRGLPRQILLATCNAAFLCFVVPNPVSWAVMLVFILCGYVVARWVQTITAREARGRVVTVYVILLLIAFVILKEYTFVHVVIPPGAIARWVSIIGISYMLFRQIHFVVDVSEGQIEHPSLWAYLNYQLNLFALFAGPIQRYQDFTNSWDSTAPLLLNTHDQLLAFSRLLIGMLKVTVFGALALKMADAATAQQLYARVPRDIVKFAILFYAYPAYIYFNFSGYCDIVIAGAALLGLHLPENFNRPYLARNVIDYWTRWHMTLTHWIRDYIFTPLYKKGVEHEVMSPVTLSYIAYFVALFLSGLWHGTTWNFAVWGLLHGGGVSVTKMWEERIIRKKGRPGLRQYLKSTPIKAVAMIVTFNFVCFTFLFFPTDLRGRMHFLKEFATGRPTSVHVESQLNDRW